MPHNKAIVRKIRILAIAVIPVSNIFMLAKNGISALCIAAAAASALCLVLEAVEGFLKE